MVIKFHNGQGTPANATLALENGSIAGDGTYSVRISPGGSVTIPTRGLSGSALWQGWAEVASTTNLAGFAVFRQLKSRPIEGTVSLTPMGTSRMVMPFDSTGATGLAIANTSDLSATVTASPSQQPRSEYRDRSRFAGNASTAVRGPSVERHHSRLHPQLHWLAWAAGNQRSRRFLVHISRTGRHRPAVLAAKRLHFASGNSTVKVRERLQNSNRTSS